MKKEIFTPSFFVRILLAAVLLYFVHGETGTWTTITLALIFLEIETQGALVKIHGIMIDDLRWKSHEHR